MSLETVSVTFDADNLTAALEVVSFELDESLSAPYELKARISAGEEDFEPGTLLGEPVTVLVERGTLSRDVHGIVVRVEEGRRQKFDNLRMIVTVMPAWCALGQRKTSRIFSSMTVPEIVEEVAGPLLSHYDRNIDASNLSATYPPLEYTVQLDETDQAFLERLMAEHGIGYTFDHSGSTETLTLFDDISSFGTLESAGNSDGVLPVHADGASGVADTAEAQGFQLVSKMQPTSAAVQVFDWLNPGSVLTTSTATASAHDDLDRPVDGAARAPERVMTHYDEPVATLGSRDAATDIARVEELNEMRRELQRRDAAVGRGRATAIGMQPAVRFTLSNHPQPALDATFVCVRVHHRWGKIPGRETQEYESDFQTLPAGVAWRPDRARTKPRVHGIQTATVVGPAGEEIHTDAHGRIQVQFHWDTQATSNNGLSCYLRVMQSLAGNGWGAVFLPRIGMEVVVSFIDGDPDRPVVTGCLYNGTHEPPHTLPDNKTVTTLKTQSTGQTGGFNELSFEDADGTEEVYLRAQRNLREVVLHDHTTTITNDQTNTVGGNDLEEITGNQTLNVTGNRTLIIDGDFVETVHGNETRTVDGNVEETIGGNESRTVSGNVDETITGNRTETVTGGVTETVTGAFSLTSTAGITTTTPGAHSLTANAGVTITTTAGVDIVAPTGLTVTGSGITLVDNNYFSIAAVSSSITGQATGIVGYALGVTGLKTDFGGVSTGVNGVNLAANGVDLSTSGINNDNVGVKIRNAKTSIENAASRVLISAIMMII